MRVTVVLGLLLLTACASGPSSNDGIDPNIAAAAFVSGFAHGYAPMPSGASFCSPAVLGHPEAGSYCTPVR